MGFVEMVETEEVQGLLKTWVPLVGACLSLVLSLVPMRDVLRCRRNKRLGEVGRDPLYRPPFCLMWLCEEERASVEPRAAHRARNPHPTVWMGSVVSPPPARAIPSDRSVLLQVNGDVFPLIFCDSVGWVVYAGKPSTLDP